MLGIDVSKHNGNINWTEVKNSGVSFVIIRCGYRGSSTGALIEDPKFKANVQGATAAGLKVGIYFFTQAVNQIEAVEEASMTVSLIKNYKISYPVFLDVEASGGRADGLDLSLIHISQAVIAICDLIAPQEDEERVWAVFPSELIHFVRQYSSEIQMPYGRDMVVASWEHVEHPMYALMESDIVRIDLLAELADDYQCQYIILNKAKNTEGDPESSGLKKIAEVGGYDIFRNVDVPILKKTDTSH